MVELQNTEYIQQTAVELQTAEYARSLVELQNSEEDQYSQQKGSQSELRDEAPRQKNVIFQIIEDLNKNWDDIDFDQDNQIQVIKKIGYL